MEDKAIWVSDFEVKNSVVALDLVSVGLYLEYKLV